MVIVREHEPRGAEAARKQTSILCTLLRQARHHTKQLLLHLRAGFAAAQTLRHKPLHLLYDALVLFTVHQRLEFVDALNPVEYVLVLVHHLAVTLDKIACLLSY